eukprot:scaffold4013_cov192-Ochromonas_danica.AAC.12
MRRWYEWVISRKVFLVERFPVRLRALGNLTTTLNYESYCMALRSIVIRHCLREKMRSLDSSLLSVLKERMHLFLRECNHLEGMIYYGFGDCSEVRDLVFSALIRGLKTNSLQNVCIELFTSISKSTMNMIRQLLVNHLSTIHDLEFSSPGVSEGSIDRIMNILNEKTTPLKKLCLHADHISLQTLLRLLERREYLLSGEFLSSIENVKPRRFDDFSTHTWVSIEVNEVFSELVYIMLSLNLSKEESEIFLECLLLAIQRSQLTLTVSNVPFCYYLVTEHHNDWILFKSKLSPYLTDLEGEMSESILIEALKDLPRLEKLSINLDEDKLSIDLEEKSYSDLSLAAIMEYGSGIKTLSINGCGSHEYGLEQCSFSDDMISKMIRGCQKLEVLKIPGAGQESVLAAKHHSMLREVYLLEVIVGKEEMSRLLCVDEREGGEKCVWRRLRKGEINGAMGIYNYNKEKRCWEWSIQSACLLIS